MKLIRIGVDLAKNVFQIHGVDRFEKPIWRKKLNRADWLKTVLERIGPGCEIGMEACTGAHHWTRQLQRHGYADNRSGSSGDARMTARALRWSVK